MMRLINYFQEKMQKHFTVWDYGLLKTYGAIFGLILGAYYAEFVQANVWIFVGAFLVIMFRFLYLLFIKK